MLDDGTLAGYIDELSVTGLTSNPTIFDKAIGGGDAYDEQIAELARAGPRGRGAVLRARAHRPAPGGGAVRADQRAHRRVDGRVSLEVSPLLADDAEATIKQAAELYGRAEGNFFIKIPGTEAGREAIEESIFAGIPVNVTLLFSTEQYLGAAEAYMRGLERRIEAGLEPGRRLGRLAVHQPLGRRGRRRGPGRAPQPARDRGRQAHLRAPTASCSTPTAHAARNEGARPQRLLWASTGTKDPDASDVALHRGPRGAVHGQHDAREDAARVRRPRRGRRAAAADGGDAEETLEAFNDAGDRHRRARRALQEEGAEAFVDSWSELLETIAEAAPAAA